jgi:hypothetical protein
MWAFIDIYVFIIISEGLIGMAVAGGVVVAIGGLVGLGLALLKKPWYEVEVSRTIHHCGWIDNSK